MDNRRLKKFIEYTEEIRTREDEIKEFKDKIKPIEEYLIDNMVKAGQQSANLGGKCIYIQTQLWAKKINGDTDELHAALEGIGKADLVEAKVNSNRLSAMVREYDLDLSGLPVLPEELKTVVEVTSKTSVRLRSA